MIMSLFEDNTEKQMRTIDSHTPFSSVIAHPGAVAVITELAPEVLDSPMSRQLDGFPAGALIDLILGKGDPRTRALLEALGAFEDLSPELPYEAPVIPRDDYEPQDVERASAVVELPTAARARARVEVVLHGPRHGNPFVDVALSARFVLGEQEIAVNGFYDGEGRYVLRFLPPAPGEWSFSVTSNARTLDGVVGRFTVEESDALGAVRVVERTHFAYADGTPFIPVGTTAYVWTHQPEDVQDRTIAALAASPFSKIRMGLFPKDFLYNSNEPERFVFEKHADGSWDTTRFDVQYFRDLERRLTQLSELGIQADLILFHPYDRWGLSTLTRTADDRYVSYVVRRLSAFPHVWWSLANEYDLILTKRREDWDRLAEVVRANDPVGHPLSIHNWIELFDYTAPWATHASIQNGEFRLSEKVDEWRRRWGKPVVIDETGYEGDLDQGWGNLTAEEMVRRFWEASIRGGYVTHGETFHRDDEMLWWSKGGELHGESPDRIRFLSRIIAESPTGRMDPLPSDWDFPSGGADGYSLTYFGANRPAFRDLVLPDDPAARVEVIDTWNMTIEDAGVHRGRVRIPLPARPYIALRVTTQ